MDLQVCVVPFARYYWRMSHCRHFDVVPRAVQEYEIRYAQARLGSELHGATVDPLTGRPERKIKDCVQWTVWRRQTELRKLDR